MQTARPAHNLHRRRPPPLRASKRSVARSLSGPEPERSVASSFSSVQPCPVHVLGVLDLCEHTARRLFVDHQMDCTSHSGGERLHVLVHEGKESPVEPLELRQQRAEQ